MQAAEGIIGQAAVPQSNFDAIEFTLFLNRSLTFLLDEENRSSCTQLSISKPDTEIASVKTSMARFLSVGRGI